MRIDSPDIVNAATLSGSLWVTGSVEPGTNASFNFGSPTKSWSTVYATSLSGSLTKLATGGDYLVAGAGIQLSTGSTGAVTITSTVAGASLVAGSNTQVQFNDGGTFGANSGLTYNKTTGAVTGTYVVASTGFSGSLTKLNDGSNYIVGSGGVVVTTGSNGSITMSLGSSTYTTASFTNATSVLVNHAMGTTIYDIEVFDTSYSKIIPMTATATTPTQANITFAIPTSGFIAVGGPTSGVTGAGLLQAAIYSGANNVTQTSVGLDTPINVQNTLYSLGSDITRPTNSRFTLSGPGTYRLQAVIGLVDSVQNYSGYRWYDVTNSVYVGTQGYAEDAAGGNASSAIPVAYVTISSATTYELRQNFSGVTVSSVYDGQIQVEITKVTGFTSALGITPTAGSAPYYGARAWVNFDGTSTGSWPGGSSTVTRTAGSTTATITTTSAHGLTTGNTVYALTGVAAGSYVVTVTSITTFTITTVATTALSAASITFAVNTIRGSGNVSSVTDLGVGTHTINFITPMPDTNYSFAGSTAWANAQPSGVMGSSTSGTQISTSSLTVYMVGNASDALIDIVVANVVIFR
jgi:hypothetical protein